MRITVTFADDVAAELRRLRRERSIRLSEAVNQLARAGVARRQIVSRQADALARGCVALWKAGPFESAALIRATRDERDAEILARTGPDPDLAGLAEHTLAHTVLPVEKPS